MTTWRVHYEDGGVIEGETPEEWRAAPDHGVQVVVLMRTPIRENRELRWSGVTDRVLWTGDDEYDPFGWGVKYGTLIDDDRYKAIWEDAKCRS